MIRHWRDPGFWRWWWHVRLSGQTKAALVFVAAAVLGVAGYWSASGLSQDEQAVRTTRLVTVVRTTPERVITEIETIVQPSVVTVRRDGRTVTVRRPGRTITSTVAGPRQIVTDKVTDTVVRTRTVPRVVVRQGRVVTLPGRVVTTPGRVVTIPAQTVTTPGQTVTTPGATQTVTREVTQPAETVIREVTLPAITQTITREITLPERTVTDTTEVTVTETETETITVTETNRRP